MTGRALGVGAVLVGMALAAGCGAAGGGGGGRRAAEPDADDQVAAAQDGPAGDLSGLLAPDEAWVLGSANLLLFGYGDRIEYALLTAGAVEDSCVGLAPVGTVRLDGQTLHVEGRFTDPDTNQQCSFELDGDVGACLDDGAFDAGFEACTLVGASGSARTGGRSFALGETAIARPSGCETLQARLGGLPQWGILNLHPLAVPFVDGPDPTRGLLLIEGTRAQVGTAANITSVQGDNFTGCLDETPTGTVSFDGTTLTIDLSLQGQDNADASGTPGNCSISFVGTVTYCAEFDPSEVGQPGGASGTIVRLDGEGSTLRNGVSTPQNVLYLFAGMGGPPMMQPGRGGGVRR